MGSRGEHGGERGSFDNGTITGARAGGGMIPPALQRSDGRSCGAGLSERCSAGGIIPPPACAGYGAVINIPYSAVIVGGADVSLIGSRYASMTHPTATHKLLA